MKCLCNATALVAHARLDASDLLVETPPKAPPGTRRPRKPPRVIPSPPPPTPQCAGGCKEYSRRGTNATVERFTCVGCGFVTTRSKGATEDPAVLSTCCFVCTMIEQSCVLDVVHCTTFHRHLAHQAGPLCALKRNPHDRHSHLNMDIWCFW